MVASRNKRLPGGVSATGGEVIVAVRALSYLSRNPRPSPSGRTKTVVVSRERHLNVGYLETRWVLVVHLYDSREPPFAMRMVDRPDRARCGRS